MSRDELLDRGRQHVNARADTWRYRLGFEFPVELRDPGARFRPRFFFAGRDIPAICDLLKKRLSQQAEKTLERSERICQHCFDLLGYQNLDYGASIDWHYDRVHGERAPRKPFYQIGYLDFAEVGDVKITWELNRHQHFVTLAKAYRLTGDEKFAKELFEQWKHWQAENPYPVGINWVSSLEVAFRSLSWLWVYFLLSDCPVEPQDFRADLLQALGTSGRHIERYLSTYFSPNTHLLGEGVALFFIGTLCPELEAAERWKKRGWGIVLQAAERQVGSDGLHFERSTYYHIYALDFFLHARILASLNGTAIPRKFDETLENMLYALCLLGRAGAPPRFGDDDGGRLFDGQRNRAGHLLDPLATGAVLFGRGDFKFLVGEVREETLWLLGLNGVAQFDGLTAAEPLPASAALESAGLYLMADRERAAQLVIDAGPQGAATAGHGHADALSVCVNSEGRNLLIDPGTYEYVGQGPERNDFRGTAAHNTLRVDGMDQADAKGPFAWGNLAKTKVELWITGEHFDLFAGHNEGYCRLAQPVIHRRWVFSLKSHFWLVRDLAEGAGRHQIDLYWHASPELLQCMDAARVLEFSDQQCGIALLTTPESGWTQEVLEKSCSPAYGCKQPCAVVHFGVAATLPTEFVSLLLPICRAAFHPGELLRIEGETDRASVRGYRYKSPDEDYCIFFAATGKSWSLGPWASDAEFVCLSRKPVGQRKLILCNGSYVAIGGRRVVSCTQAATRCEIVETNGQTEVFSSNNKLVVQHLSLDSITLSTEPMLMADRPPGSNRTYI
jgi:hypothetical protein